MEKIPGLRAIGTASSETKEQEKHNLIKKLYHHNDSLSDERKELLQKFEKQKTTEEIQAIELANQEISNLRQSMGLQPFHIPSDNYHILDQNFYEEHFGRESLARAFFHEQGIVFNEDDARKSLLSFAQIVLHETLHLHGHTTLEVNERENGRIESTHFRQGIGVYATQKKHHEGEFHAHFVGLHEAIVSEQEKRSLGKIMQSPLFEKESAFLSSDTAEHLKDAIADSFFNIERGDIIWISENGGEFQCVEYSKPRKVLNFVCDKIFENFPKEFTSSDEVFTLFLKAHITGQLLDIARLVEDTFGKGSFRRLGDMDRTSHSAVQTYEALRNMVG
jgi:hypothetical protein